MRHGDSARVSGPRGPYRLRFACRFCGAPCGRAGAACTACQPRARSERLAHRASERRAWQAAYHARHRPAPTPIPQPRGDLPPRGVLLADDDGTRIQCHACGAWLSTLVRHVAARHGLRADAYRERYELRRGTGLVAPATSAKLAAAAQRTGNLVPGPPPPRPTGTANRLEARVRISRARSPVAGEGA